MDAETLVSETEVKKTHQCPHCDPNFLKHLIAGHKVKLCNGCDGEIEENKNFKWAKSDGALKAHWNFIH